MTFLRVGVAWPHCTAQSEREKRQSGAKTANAHIARKEVRQLFFSFLCVFFLLFCTWGNANLSHFLSLRFTAGLLTHGKRGEVKGGRGSCSVTVKALSSNLKFWGERFLSVLSSAAAIWHQGRHASPPYRWQGSLHIWAAHLTVCARRRGGRRSTCLLNATHPPKTDDEFQKWIVKFSSSFQKDMRCSQNTLAD